MPDAGVARPVAPAADSPASIAIATAPWNKKEQSHSGGKGRGKGHGGGNKGRDRGGRGKGKGHADGTTPWADHGGAASSSASSSAAGSGIAASSQAGLAPDGSQLFMRRDGSLVSGQEMQQRVETCHIYKYSIYV